MGLSPKDVERTLLEELRGALDARGIAAVLITDKDGRAAVDVTDCDAGVRRVYVHLSFYWFIWGDGPDERSSCFRMPETALRLAAEAVRGWSTSAGTDPRGLTSVLDSYAESL